MFDKIQKLAENRAHQFIAWGYIIKAKQGVLKELYENAKVYELASRYRQVAGVLPNFLRQYIPFGSLGLGIKAIPRFNMIVGIFPRNIIFDMAEWHYVDRIFSDEPMFALAYPTLPIDGIYRYETKRGRIKMFTSTFWTKKLIGADEANNMGYTGKGVLVAIPDTGSRETHPQVRGRLVTKSVLHGQYVDGEGHGVWCSTCIGGRRWIDRYLSEKTGRTVYCEGMAPDVRMLGIKCLGYGIGMGSTSSIIEGVDLALKYRADVISMSLGGEVKGMSKPEDDPEYYVFQDAVKQGAIPVVAAGNSGPNSGTIGTPAWLPNVLSVGAASPFDGKVTSFSSRGPTPDNRVKPDTCSYGYMIDSGIAGQLDFAGDNMYSKATPISGTSMATPHVAGLVALMVEATRRRAPWLRWTLDKIYDMLKKTATEPKNNDCGYGLMTWDKFVNYMSTEYSVRI